MLRDLLTQKCVYNFFFLNLIFSALILGIKNQKPNIMDEQVPQHDVTEEGRGWLLVRGYKSLVNHTILLANQS
jgi:hypothetical protein